LYGSRVAVPCTELEARGGVGFTVNVGGIEIQIRELKDLTVEQEELKRGGVCTLNAKLDAVWPIVGRSILDSFDVILDGVNKRIVISEKSVFDSNNRVFQIQT